MKQQKNLTLDVDVVKKIEELAKKDRRQFSGYVNKVLIEHIEQIEASEAKESQKEDK